MISGGFVSFELTSSFFLKDAFKYQSDNPQAGLCKDWNFTEQAVGFYVPFERALSTAAKQLLNFCAEKGTRILLLNCTFSENWLSHPPRSKTVSIKTQFLYRMVIQ